MENENVPGSVSDSGWTYEAKSSRPERGVRDYSRTVSFPNMPSFADLQEVCQWLKEGNCPGNCGVWTNQCEPEKNHTNTYIFYTTWDSSD